MHPEETRLLAQALLSEVEWLAATLPVLRQQQAETQAALEQVRMSACKDQIRALERALKRLERTSSLRRQGVPELRAEGERLLASLRAEDLTSRHQPQA